MLMPKFCALPRGRFGSCNGTVRNQKLRRLCVTGLQVLHHALAGSCPSLLPYSVTRIGFKSSGTAGL